MKLKTFTFYLLSSLLFTLGAKAQEQKIEDPIAELVKIKSLDWQVLTALPTIGISYKYNECHDNYNGFHREDVFLKMSNVSTLPVKIEYDLVLWYEGVCVNCNTNNSELHFELDLSAGSERVGDCSDKTAALRFMSSLLNTPGEVKKLSNFSIRNLKVTSLN